LAARSTLATWLRPEPRGRPRQLSVTTSWIGGNDLARIDLATITLTVPIRLD
jgi:hypothetical protein